MDKRQPVQSRHGSCTALSLWTHSSSRQRTQNGRITRKHGGRTATARRTHGGRRRGRECDRRACRGTERRRARNDRRRSGRCRDRSQGFAAIKAERELAESRHHQKTRTRRQVKSGREDSRGAGAEERRGEGEEEERDEERRERRRRKGQTAAREDRGEEPAPTWTSLSSLNVDSPDQDWSDAMQPFKDEADAAIRALTNGDFHAGKIEPRPQEPARGELRNDL